jgi:hypothetical protein
VVEIDDAVPVVALYAPVYREGDPAMDSARQTQPVRVLQTLRNRSVS